MIPPGDLVAGRSMRHRTPDQVLGPYFPQERARVEQSDLTGADGIAQGEVIEVTGRILDRNGDPVWRGMEEICKKAEELLGFRFGVVFRLIVGLCLGIGFGFHIVACTVDGGFC